MKKTMFATQLLALFAIVPFVAVMEFNHTATTVTVNTATATTTTVSTATQGYQLPTSAWPVITLLTKFY